MLLALVAALALASCATQEAATPDRRQEQIRTLENIAALERETAAFAESCDGVRGAEVYIRSNSAVVILSAAEHTRLRADAIAKISTYIAERTGLAEDKIVIKARSAPMRGTTP